VMTSECQWTTHGMCLAEGSSNAQKAEGFGR